MKKWLLLACLLLGITGLLHGQTNPVLGLFPKGTRLMPNLPYAGDTLSTVSYTHLTLPTICSV